jgi:hypothetical protein
MPDGDVESMLACSGCAESPKFSGVAAGRFRRAPIHGDVAALSFHWMNQKPIRFNRCAGSVHPTETILTERQRQLLLEAPGMGFAYQVPVN